MTQEPRLKMTTDEFLALPDREKDVMSKKPLVITNVAFGNLYRDIFLDFHLKAMLDESNIPAEKDRVLYQVFTDDETAPYIKDHPNFKKLSDLIPTSIALCDWLHKELPNKFSHRYETLVKTFHPSVQLALQKEAYLSAIVADLIPAKGFITKILQKMDEGHGAVFMLPLRSSFEAMAPILAQAPGALEPKDLVSLGHNNIHPLWWACEWRNPRFTRLPFSTVWSSETGVMARSFSVTPIIMKPTIHMLNAKQVIDVEIPSHCEKIYWCENWTDAPIIGVEPTLCYYPPCAPKKSNTDEVGLWAQKSLHPTQFDYLKKRFYYPDKETAKIPEELEKESDTVVSSIMTYGGYLI